MIPPRSPAPTPHAARRWVYGLLGALYFSQGLPFGFFVQAMPVLLRNYGYSLVDIGLSSLLAAPWALKFLWAPAVDRFSIASLGRRRTWLLPLQVLAVVLLLVTAGVDPQRGIGPLLVLVFLINLVSATQDIATDGLAIDLLAPEQRGFANGLQVAGYRVGMIVGGGALLIAFDRLGFSGTFGVMAGLIAISTLPVWLLREESEPLDPASRPAASLRAFFKRPHAGRIVAVVLTYKAGDAFATSMLRPFLADTGLRVAEIGWLLGTVGFIAGMLGALAGGAWIQRIGRRSALLWFGALQATSLGGYVWMAAHPELTTLLPWVCGFEHFAGGMATAALFTCMMDWTGAQSHATDYTIQASGVVIVTIAASALAGLSAESLGYAWHFASAIGLSALALGFVARLPPVLVSGKTLLEPGTQPFDGVDQSQRLPPP